MSAALLPDAARVQPALTLFARGLALLALEAVAVVFGVWCLLHWSELPMYGLRNQIEPAQRLGLLAGMFGVAATVSLTGVLYALTRGANGTRRIHELACRLAPISVLGLLPLLFKLELWVARELTFLVLAAAAAVGLRGALLTAQRAPPLWSSARAAPTLPSHHVWPPLIVALGILAYVAYFAWFTILSHHNLGTSGFDLALEDNILWNIANGGDWFKSSPFAGPEGGHFGNHATFFAYVIALVYRFAERAETLLVIQAIVTGAAAWPLYLLARLKLNRWPAAVIALCYLLNPGLHGSVLFDFHYQPLAPFFLWFMLYFALREKFLLTVIFAAIALSLREDIGLMLLPLGLFLLLSGERPKTGFLLALLGVAWYVVLKIYVMPQFSGGYHAFVEMYRGLLVQGEDGFLSVLKTVIGNPAFTLTGLLEREKLVYLLQIMCPLALLPLVRPMGLLFCLPGLVVTLLSTGYQPLYQLSFQYTAYWTACLFIAVVAFLPEARSVVETVRQDQLHRQRAWIIAILVSTLVISHQFGAVLQQRLVRYGFGYFRFAHTEQDERNYQAVRELIAQVPGDAKVAACTIVLPHVSNRENAYSLFMGYFDAEYLFLCMPQRRTGERDWGQQALNSGEFGVVMVRENFVLARRGHDTAQNPEIVPRL